MRAMKATLPPKKAMVKVTARGTVRPQPLITDTGSMAGRTLSGRNLA